METQDKPLPLDKTSPGLVCAASSSIGLSPAHTPHSPGTRDGKSKAAGLETALVFVLSNCHLSRKEELHLQELQRGKV